MACLSFLMDGGVFVICANPIHLLKEPDLRDGAVLTFEVLESDASSLLSRLGTIQEYALDAKPFWGRLVSLDPCQSTHPALGLLQDKPTLRGVLTIVNRTQPSAAKN